MARHLRLLLLSLALSIIGTALWFLLDQQYVDYGSRKSIGVGKTATNYSPSLRQFQLKNTVLPQIAHDGESGLGMVSAGTVKARVVDEWGQALSEGSIALFCAEHGQLLPGPRIQLDEDGWFEATGCAQGVCAELSHTSKIQDGPWLLQIGQVAELRARSLAALQGTVRSFNGSLVVGAKLTLLDNEYDPVSVAPTVTRHTSTDLEGRYQYFWLERPICDICASASGRCLLGEERELPVYEGELLLIVSAPGFRIHSQVVVGPSADDLDIVLQPPEAPVVGTLVDAAGKFYLRAKVVIESKERPYEKHSAVVKDGTFRFGNLGTGPYSLVVRQDGVVIAEQDEVYAGSTPEIIGSETVDDRSVQLQVVFANGIPAAGVEIRGGPFDGQVTDLEGRAQVHGVLPGKYSVTAIGSRFPRLFQQFDVGKEARMYQFDIQQGEN